jgi:hypothetical protein
MITRWPLPLFDQFWAFGQTEQLSWQQVRIGPKNGSAGKDGAAWPFVSRYVRVVDTKERIRVFPI